MTFWSMVNDPYVETAAFSVEQAKRFYPDSRFYIYDVGLTDKQRFLDLGCIVVPWEIDLDKWEDFKWRELYNRDVGPYSSATPYCLRHLLETEDDVVTLDADFFMIRPIDEIFNDISFDVGLTIREDYELRHIDTVSEFEILGPINFGCGFFLGNREVNVRFADLWIQDVEDNPENPWDQAGLNRFVFKAGIEDGPYRVGYVDGDIRMKTFPVKIYNNYHFDRGLDGVKMIHGKNRYFDGKTQDDLRRMFG